MAQMFPNGLNSGPMFGVVPPTASNTTTNAAGLTQTPTTMAAPATPASTPEDDTQAKRLALAQNTIVGSPISGSDRLGGS